MGGDGNNAGTISAGGTTYSWGSATSTDRASETTTTWASWTDPSTPTVWTSSTLGFTYTKTSWTYNPASSSVYWSWVGRSLTTTAPSTWTTSSAPSAPSVAYDPTAWSSTLCCSFRHCFLSIVVAGRSDSDWTSDRVIHWSCLDIGYECDGVRGCGGNGVAGCDSVNGVRKT